MKEEVSLTPLPLSAPTSNQPPTLPAIGFVTQVKDTTTQAEEPKKTEVPLPSFGVTPQSSSQSESKVVAPLVNFSVNPTPVPNKEANQPSSASKFVLNLIIIRLYHTYHFQCSQERRNSHFELWR